MLDYIIVGQGISGTLLGYNLLKAGKKILIIDNDEKNSSSRVAAGIFNPVTGKRKVKTWQADQLFDYLNNFYPKFEQELGCKFFYNKPIYMLFDSIEEQNLWAGKIADPIYKDYLDVNTNPGLYNSSIHDEFGGILAKNSGYVNVQDMIFSFKKYATEHNSFLQSDFDYDELKINEGEIFYKDLTAKNIIFCEGASLVSNPLFSWLPFNLVKGELLLLELEYIPDVIFNKNIFILPLDDKHCIAGATYNWDDRTTDTTVEAKETLKEKIDQLLKISYKITDQKAGIRPATKDRRPFLGTHPEHKNVFVFGGLGTKGVSIAPLYAHLFFDYLENGKELEKDVNISRHYSLYYLNNNTL